MPVLNVDGLGGQTSLTATPATIGTTETVAHQMRLQANDVQVGTVIRCKARGTLSAGSAGTLRAFLRLGTAGTVADSTVCATTLKGSATAAVGWMVEFEMTVRAVTASGAVLGNGIAIIAQTIDQTSQTATVAFNATVANWLSLTLVGGGTTPVITVTNAHFEIVKP